MSDGIPVSAEGASCTRRLLPGRVALLRSSNMFMNASIAMRHLPGSKPRIWLEGGSVAVVLNVPEMGPFDAYECLVLSDGKVGYVYADYVDTNVEVT